MKKIITLLVLLFTITVNSQIYIDIIKASGNSSPITYDYYVSNSGSDSNDGLTPATAWATHAKVSTESVNFTPGQSVAYEGGHEFYGNLLLNAAADDIEITSYASGKSIFTGGEAITGWTNTSGNIWEADVTGKTIYQVFKNEEVLQLSRYPKIVDDLDPESNFYTVTSNSTTTTFICSDLIGFPDITGATVQINGNEWDTNSRVVQNFTSGTGEITLSGAEIDGGLSAGDLFYVINDYDLLDANNEWYYDSGADKLFVHATSSPTGIVANTFNGSGVTLNTNDNITFSNIIFEYFNVDGINSEASDNLKVDTCEFYYCYRTSVYTGGTTSTGTIVQYSYFKGGMENAININNNKLYTDISNSTILKNTFFEHGLLKQATAVQYNIMHAVRPQGSTHSITHNHFEKIGYNGIRIYGRDTDVENNYFKNYCLTNHDGAAIYSQGGSDKNNNQVQNTNIFKNIIVATFASSDSWFMYSIYADDNSTLVDILENSISGGVNGIFLHNTKDCTVQGNNIFGITNNGLIAIESVQGGAVAMTGNVISFNNILSDNTNESLYVRQTKSGDATYAFGDIDFNKYWNTGNTDDAHHNTTQESENTYTLASWATKYSSEMTTTQEANSTSDLNYTVDARQFVYNNTSSVTVPFLNGTWDDMDGSTYNGSITMQPFTSKILYQITVGSNPELLTCGDFSCTTNWNESEADWTIASNVATYVGSTNNSSTSKFLIYDFNSLTAGQDYQLTFDVNSDTTTQNHIVTIYGGGSPTQVISSGTYGSTVTINFTANNASRYISFGNRGLGTMEIDNVSLKEQ